MLLALVLGFYFFPETTKDAVDTTGEMVKDVSEKVFDDVKENDDFKESFN